MKDTARAQKQVAELDDLIEEIIVDAYGEDEQLSSFCQVFEDEIGVPCDAFVIGEPVAVIAFDYDGNERRGVTAKVRREDGAVHAVAAADVVLPSGAKGARCLAAYRRWLGLEPFLKAAGAPAKRERRHKVAASDLDLSGTIDPVVLAVKDKAAGCWLVGSDRGITLRAEHLWDLAPGESITVRPRKQWRYAGHPYLSGEILSARLDVSALELVPLKLECRGKWDPQEHYWGEEGEPIDEWAEPIIARGPRPEFEMEQVIPGEDPDDPDTDPIIESNELAEAGDPVGAPDSDGAVPVRAPLPGRACAPRQPGLCSLSGDRDPALRGGIADRRALVWPRLRRSAAVGVDRQPAVPPLHARLWPDLWRLRRFDEAERVFERMLWLNPSDNQGANLLLPAVKNRAPWKDD
jgi:hypothetical protein